MLSKSLKGTLRKLISNEPRLAEQIEVLSINDIAIKLYTANFAKPNLINEHELSAVIGKIVAETDENKFPVFVSFVRVAPSRRYVAAKNLGGI